MRQLLALAPDRQGNLKVLRLNCQQSTPAKFVAQPATGRRRDFGVCTYSAPVEFAVPKWDFRPEKTVHYPNGQKLERW